MATALDFLSDPRLGLVRERREPQLRMAKSVEDVLANGGVYLVEGPVGCGKTFAYLTPALLAAGRKVVIATAKKQLQDQVYEKDLPAIARVIDPETLKKVLRGGPENAPQLLCSVLKGKSNYVCQHQAKDYLQDAAFRQFLQESQYGDFADYAGQVPPYLAKATAEECIGRVCDLSQTCGFIRLKDNVAQSRMVVINHHLLGLDMALGLGKLVGGAYTVLVVDEAHKLVEGIRNAFTVRVAEKSIERLHGLMSRTSWIERAPINAAKPVWGNLFDGLENKHYRDAHLREIPVFPRGVEDAVAALGLIENDLNGIMENYGIEVDASDPDVHTAIANADCMDDTKHHLALVGRARRRVDEMGEALEIMQGRVKAIKGEDPEDYEMRKDRILANRFVSGEYTDANGFTLECAPINVGGLVRHYLEKVPAVILTSATLEVLGSFDHLLNVIGVPASKTEVLPTTFNYATQGFLYVPRDLPHRLRTAEDYPDVLKRRIERCVDLCRLSQGGAFVLTTANDELDLFTSALKAAFPGRVFAQGHAKNAHDGQAATVLERFLATPDSILVGSKTFWEGVDVPGEQLRLVVIAKLPFPIYTDPVIKAREKAAGKENAFRTVQMVDMLTDLRQGAGRLIRAKTDRGVVAILDSRVWDKPYGAQVRSILQFPVVDDFKKCAWYLPQLVRYFQQLAQRGSHGATAQSL